MVNDEYATNNFWKPTHTAYAYELSDEDECEAPKKKAPKTEAAEQAHAPEYCINVGIRERLLRLR